MRMLLALAVIVLSATVADAGTRCPPGTYVARYGFGIWVCKQITRPRLACPPREHLTTDLWGTPTCIRHWPRRVG